VAGRGLSLRRWGRRVSCYGFKVVCIWAASCAEVLLLVVKRVMVRMVFRRGCS
jgi:hypothetical protein